MNIYKTIKSQLTLSTLKKIMSAKENSLVTNHFGGTKVELSENNKAEKYLREFPFPSCSASQGIISEVQLISHNFSH